VTIGDNVCFGSYSIVGAGSFISAQERA